jgi:hypothetical protein
MLKVNLLVSLRTVKSKKLIWLSSSVSIVNL